MINRCGLLTLQKEPVPLKSIEVQLEVRDHVATVVSTLNYENKEDKPLEAVFVFPLPGDAAVCHFSAKIGQTQIVAEVKEKQKAREEYDDAVSSGQQAFLLEESDQSPDIFSLSVGSLPPGESASIRLEYVTELAVQADDGLRFCLPAVLNPRYQPQGSEDAGVQVTSVPASLVPYSLSFSARVSSPRPISKVESNCSLDPLQYLNTDQTQATVKLAAGHKFDRDVELLIYYKDAHQPAAVVEAGQASAELGSLMGDPVVMVSLYPEFPQSVMSSLASCGEFVFLMDRSGSMSNTRIRSARDTLLLLLKSLPMGCYFNIYSFGSRYEHIFPKSVEYSQQTMEEALKTVEQMQANLGGTEILQPLKHIYSQPCIPNQPRQLFVFTDGEVWNTKEVIDLVKKNSGSHRCFSFGIGEGASSALINGMAKEGGGHAQFITGTDRMQPKVMQSLRFALQPAVVDVSVTWDLPKEVSVTVLSPPITALFQGQRSLIYAQLSGQSSEAAEGCVTVKYSLAGHPSENQLHFSLRPAEDTGLTVHRLGARTLIRSLEMDERESRGQQDGGVKEKVVKLSVQSGVSSSFTAFIAVNKDNSEVIQGPLVRRNIPTPSASSEQPPRDPLLHLVSLQEASGCWLLDPALATVLGKTNEEVEKSKPEKANSEVWATILALLWLHAFKMDAKGEWELLAMKAASWLRAQNVHTGWWRKQGNGTYPAAVTCFYKSEVCGVNITRRTEKSRTLVRIHLPVHRGTMMNRCGLLTLQKEPVPLKSIEVELEVRDHVATVVSTLNYENKEDKPLEAVFVFPLPGDAAVCHFSAKIGQTQIVAEVKEKQKAREEYDDALSSGQQAFLLEESDQSPDIFSLSVGSLPPGESASIRLEYVTELAVQADDGLRFCLPGVLNPRYQPQGSEDAGVQVTSVPASLVPYSLSFSARVSSPRPISKVESNCSLDPLQYLNTDQTQATVKLAAGHKFDRDVELLIYYKDAHQPTAVVEAGQASAEPGSLMGDPVVMVSLYPEFPQSVMSSMASCGEFVFLMDRSGSMGCPITNSKQQETRISSARDTLLLLLKSLPMGCYFNIYSFGSGYEHIFPKSVEYSQQTMEEALKTVEQMEANLGGTEILEPLKHIYSQPCIPNQPRQLFVFTDGEVGNTKEVIDLVKTNSGSHRCFSFGIGEGASSALINGMAKEGGGHAQFITGTDRMQPKVMQSLRFALQPAVVDISVTWDLPKEVSVTVLSPPITALFQGQRSLIYAQLSGQSSEAAEGCVTVKYSLAGHPSENQLHFSLRPAEDTGLTVHRLGARTLIRSLEMQERENRGQQDGGVKEKVVKLSVQSGVSSSFTAFIAVNKDNSEMIQGPLVRRNIPTPGVFAMAQCSAGVMRRKMLRPICGPARMRSSFGGGVVHDMAAAPERPPRDPLLHLVSLQGASGCWLLDPSLATALGKTNEEVEKSKPEKANSEVWATILALIWLHAFKMDAKDEWELLAMKAASWLRAQNAPYVTECVDAGNVLLGCSVKKEALGL
ncbi:elongation factor 1-alpha [Sarotherodon galilaeus]